MKFYETHFDEYITTSEVNNLHPSLTTLVDKFPSDLHQMTNLILYGPSGTGKYTQMLKIIKKYSQSECKYEKRMSITFNKQPYYFKISDIHFEIDMTLLGCNSKLLWHDIYQQIQDIVSSRQEKVGIVLCKNFHEIHNELLDNFYSYMQKNPMHMIDLKFFLLTKEISFLPDNILHCCHIIHVPMPSPKDYKKCFRNRINLFELSEQPSLCTVNLKNLYLKEHHSLENHKLICNKLLQSIKNIEQIPFSKCRDRLYDMLIYHLDISECIWYFLSSLIEDKSIQREKLSLVYLKTFQFLQYYNNNYRPIYHLEKYFYFLTTVVN
jgi:hypothetical protein